MYPCTVDEASWTRGVSIESLFGHLCSGTSFVHDEEMLSRGSQPPELQVGKRQRVETDPSDNLYTPSQRNPDHEGDQKPEIDSNHQKTLASTSPVHDQKCDSFSPAIVHDGNEKNSTIALSLPHDNFLHEQRPYSVRSPFRDQETHSHPSQSTGLQNRKRRMAEAHPSLENIRTPSQGSPSYEDTQSKNFDSGYRISGSPASSVQRQKPRRSSMAIPDGGNETKSSVGTSLPFDAPHYEERLYGIRGSFQALLGASAKTTPSTFRATHTASRQQRNPSNFVNGRTLSTSTLRSENLNMGLGSSPKAKCGPVRAKCRWLECVESFDQRSDLRKHILDCHIEQGKIGGSSKHVCLWRECIDSNSLLFSNVKLFEDHLDLEHGMRASAETTVKVFKSAKRNSRESRVAPGTQESPIEVSDDSDSHSDYDGEKGNYVATPENQTAWIADDSLNETQISLSDSAFHSQESCHQLPDPTSESQESWHGVQETMSEKVRRRKESYRAAMGRSGLTWDNDRLICLGGGHSIAEIEL